MSGTSQASTMRIPMRGTYVYRSAPCLESGLDQADHRRERHDIPEPADREIGAAASEDNHGDGHRD